MSSRTTVSRNQNAELHTRDTRGRSRLRRCWSAADRRWPAAVDHDRPADGSERLPRADHVLPGPHRGYLRPARRRPQCPQGRTGRADPTGSSSRRTRGDRSNRRRAGRDVRQQWRRGSRARAGRRVPASSHSRTIAAKFDLDDTRTHPHVGEVNLRFIYLLAIWCSAHRSRTMRSAASTRRSSSKLRNPTLLPSRRGSTAAACSASTRVLTPPISTSGRKLAARADVDVGATSQVDRGS